MSTNLGTRAAANFFRAARSGRNVSSMRAPSLPPCSTTLKLADAPGWRTDSVVHRSDRAGPGVSMPRGLRGIRLETQGLGHSWNTDADENVSILECVCYGWRRGWDSKLVGVLKAKNFEPFRDLTIRQIRLKAGVGTRIEHAGSQQDAAPTGGSQLRRNRRFEIILQRLELAPRQTSASRLALCTRARIGAHSHAPI